MNTCEKCAKQDRNGRSVAHTSTSMAADRQGDGGDLRYSAARFRDEDGVTMKPGAIWN